MARRMRIRGEEVEVTVELDEGAVASELWERLPMQTKARISGGEVHFPVLVPTGAEPGNQTDVEAGHVAYHPPENAVCLFYNKASERTNLTPVGRIVEGLEDCRRIDANEDLRIEPVEGQRIEVSEDKRVALVTGAARGIGRRVALTLAERGYRIAANDLREPEAVLRELQQAEAEALSVPGDVSKEASVRGMVEAVMGEFGRIDVLVTA